MAKLVFEAFGSQLIPETHPPGPLHYSMYLGLRLGFSIAPPEATAKRALGWGGKRLATSDNTLVLRDPGGHTFELISNG